MSLPRGAIASSVVCDCDITSLILFGFLISEFTVYRGSHMSAHVLLNLLNELRKNDKMLGLPGILSLFSNQFYKIQQYRSTDILFIT